MEDKKNVVIVGGGIAGALLAKNVQGIANVTLIEPKDYFEISWTTLRSMVEPSFAEKTLVDYREFLPQVTLVTSCAANITETEVLTEHGVTVPYDYLVVATGHKFAQPQRITGALLKYQYASEKIRSANSILIIGGGPTGVELAGEITHQYPEKTIKIVHRGSRLLEFINAKASKKAMDWLTSKNVEVILNESVDWKSASDGVYPTSGGETIDADCHFDCTGKPIGTCWLKDSILSGSLDLQGRLAVDQTLRIKGWKNIFAIGDVTNIQELKQGFLAMEHAKVAAKNLKLVLEGKDEKNLAVYKPGPGIAFVSLGKKDAVAQMGCITVIGRVPGMIKSGDLFVSNIRKAYGFR